jgi:deoxyribodipyrimidine photolyase
MTLNISIICKTFRIHDNPFLNSDYYILFINREDYGLNQWIFLNKILIHHLKDLENNNIKPILLNNLDNLLTILDALDKSKYKIYADVYEPHKKNRLLNYNFNYISSWGLIHWFDKVDLIKKWFLPNGLKNHKVFKEYTHKNKRDIFSSNYLEKKSKEKLNIKSNFEIENNDNNKSYIDLPKNNLDIWVQEKLIETSFMKNSAWFKPNTCPLTSITSNNSDNIELISNNLKTSLLSPFFSIGVLSPVLAYNYWSDEKRVGSSRDQLLFREMFHACGFMNEFWNDNFGDSFKWKILNKKKWNDYKNGTTGFTDVDWSMKKLKEEGWIHHLARHLVADYLTRGYLNYDWKYGLEWFKETLLDHDEAVNRGNWLSLSGTAFSTKQRSFYHYNPEYFLTKKTLSLKCNSSKKNNSKKKMIFTKKK